MKKTSIFFQICLIVSIILVSGCSGDTTNTVVEDTQEQTVNYTQEPTIDQDMVEGELIELSSDQLLIKQANGTEVTLNLSDNTVYWEGIEWLKVFPIKVGDQILAYGEWSKDLTRFKVDQYYDNRVDIKGIVTYSSGEAGGYMLDQPDQNYVIFPLPERTQLLTHIPEGPRSFKYFKLLPRPAEYLEVVGRRVSDQNVVAVRMIRFD